MFPLLGLGLLVALLVVSQSGKSVKRYVVTLPGPAGTQKFSKSDARAIGADLIQAAAVLVVGGGMVARIDKTIVPAIMNSAAVWPNVNGAGKAVLASKSWFDQGATRFLRLEPLSDAAKFSNLYYVLAENIAEYNQIMSEVMSSAGAVNTGGAPPVGLVPAIPALPVAALPALPAAPQLPQVSGLHVSGSPVPGWWPTAENSMPPDWSREIVPRLS